MNIIIKNKELRTIVLTGESKGTARVICETCGIVN